MSARYNDAATPIGMRLRPGTRAMVGQVRALLRAESGQHATIDDAVSFACQQAFGPVSARLLAQGIDPESVIAASTARRAKRGWIGGCSFSASMIRPDVD